MDLAVMLEAVEKYMGEQFADMLRTRSARARPKPGRASSGVSARWRPTCDRPNP
jgi:hypothetical protein